LSWFAKTLGSSIGKKLVMGLTGFLLIGFVVVHLAGNLLLYAGFENYNVYAHKLHGTSLLLGAEIGLLILFVLHVFYALQTSLENRRARPEGYVKSKSKQDRSPVNASAIMFVSGAIILGFVILHLADMRFALRLAGPAEEDPASRTFRVLQNPISATVYFFGSIFLGYHLWHGFQSVFQTFGLRHPRYTPLIRGFGIFLAILLALGFASFPVWANLKKWGILP